MTTSGILIVFSNKPYIGQIIFSHVFFIQDFQRPLVMNGMTGWKLNSNLPGIEFLTRTITAKSEKVYDLQINVTEYIIFSIWSEDRMGWEYTVTRGVSGIEATQNWAICFFENPTGNFTFKVAVLKIK